MQRQHAVVVLGSASRPGASQGLLRGVPAAAVVPGRRGRARRAVRDRKSTRLNSSHLVISYAVFCLKKKKKKKINSTTTPNQLLSNVHLLFQVFIVNNKYMVSETVVVELNCLRTESAHCLASACKML